MAKITTGSDTPQSVQLKGDSSNRLQEYKTTVSYPTGVESSRSNTTFLSCQAIKPYSYFDMQGELDGKAGAGAGSVLTAIDQWVKFKSTVEGSTKQYFQGTTTDTTINLYMPNLLVNTQHEYNDSTIAWAKGITDGVNATIAGYNDGGKGIDGAGNALGELIKTMGASLGKNVTSLFDSATGGALAQTTGNVVNPKATTVYKGTALRTQTFTFQFKPSNESEVKNVHEIIKRFRGFSSPSITSSGNLDSTGAERRSDFLKIPHFWFLQEFAADTKAGRVDPSRALFRFGPAVLTNVRTNYTPDQYWVLFKSGDPVYVELELTFSELIALAQEDILTTKDIAL
jgi:hypothetical protein